MCRSHTQGYKRCKGSAATKAQESVRKSINYQAKKSGLAVWEWKVLNPDLVEMIHSTYDERLHRFEKQFSNENCEEEPTKMGVAETIAYIKAQKPEAKSLKEAIALIKAEQADPSLKNLTMSELVVKMKSKTDNGGVIPVQNKAKKVVPVVKEPSSFSDAYHADMKDKLDKVSGNENTLSTPDLTDNDIHRYNFAAQGEKRLSNSHVDLGDYLEHSESYLNKLGLSKHESHAILCYSNDSYEAVNSYLLNKKKDGIFHEKKESWRNLESGYQYSFKDEEDLMDYAQTLDSALSHRAEQPRIVYRGMNVRSHSASIKSFSDGKDVTDTQERRKIMEKQYASGSELVFDAYASASDSINIAANWCSAHSDFEDSSPTGIIFEIKSSAGVPIAHLSGHSIEREVLLPRGMKFKVTNSYWNSKDTETCYKYDGTKNSKENYARNKNTLIVQLTEIDFDGNENEDHVTKYEAPPLTAKLAQTTGDK